jgi:2'-5' RNA ligase
MHGVTSLLDPPHYAQVERLWAALADRFGVRGVYVTPFPHFSYHVAAEYDVAQVEPILQRIARQTAPFRVQTGGLGIFPGPQPVLTIAVARSAVLAQLHARLWTALAPVATGAQEHYHPAGWMPHITIGFGDLQPAVLGEIVAWLAARDFHWELPVTNLALIYDAGSGQDVRARVALSGDE